MAPGKLSTFFMTTKTKPRFFKNRPIPQPNPEKAFAKDTHYKHLDSYDFTDVVKAFDRRIKYWYFYHAKELVPKQHQGFAIVVIVSVIIDLLSQFIYGTQESSARIYKCFLRKYIPEFRKKIKPPLKSYRHVHDNGWKMELIKDFADAFYHAVRCGVVHSAMILDYAGIAGEDEVPKGRVICCNPWGDGKREVAVNPFVLLERAEQAFDQYIEKLQNPANKSLRQKFAKKFYRSFGKKIKP